MRSSGVLLPASSLPSPYGIGAFGKDARIWVDFLDAAGQKYWQILPLSPTSYGDSPYQSFSAFAGNSYFVDLDTLCEEGLLSRKDFEDINWCRTEDRVDYDTIYQHRENVLRKAYSSFTDEKALDDFIEKNPWFADYGLFMAIKKTQGEQSWEKWDEPLRLRNADAISRAKETLNGDVRYHAFVQYQFKKQWLYLKKYANDKGVEIIGDAPIYVSLDSADVWANHHMFQLDENAVPTEIAGCPPDGYSEIGQVWGNPLYDWDYMEKTGFEWWIERLEYNFDFLDVLRIDHFRGLEGYYAIPYGAETAKNGRWRTGPGLPFIDTIKRDMPGAKIIAENLGFLTDKVAELLEASGYPGMKVIQFAFDSRAIEGDDPGNYEENLVLYPGTHDNDTLWGWCNTASPDSIKNAMDYLGVTDVKLLPGAIIEMVMRSDARLAVIQMQDWLGLGSEARINTPSTSDGLNWRWRLEKKMLTDRLADSMAQITKENRREK